MKKLVALSIIFGLMASIVAINPSYASSGLKVYVSLFNDGGQPATVCVSTSEESAGCQTYSSSEYNMHMLGPFEFSPGAVGVGQGFTACASLDPGTNVCSEGVNGPENEPERVTIKVSSDGTQAQPGVSSSSASRQNLFNDLNMCSTIEKYLMSPCSTYVSTTSVLTAEGERAKGCISNGIMLSGLGFVGNLPPLTIIGYLKPLSVATGCDGIVKWQVVETDVYAASAFLKLLQIIT